MKKVLATIAATLAVVFAFAAAAVAPSSVNWNAAPEASVNWNKANSVNWGSVNWNKATSVNWGSV
ncbi:MAG: hypothetical protein M3390_08665, partial [Chloroflexota bacterium]|nr:hypothetical protein [Chloroflexota bacterium]